jgi:hypothetical protein
MTPYMSSPCLEIIKHKRENVPKLLHSAETHHFRARVLNNQQNSTRADITKVTYLFVVSMISALVHLCEMLKNIFKMHVISFSLELIGFALL